ISEDLALVATFPQLEYPREWPASVHVIGPLAWELPCEDVELPPGEAPLVLVAPSTVHDPEFRLVRATLRALADEPVRVLAAWNRRPAPAGVTVDVPPNARLVDWLSYSRVMPRCDVVVCHAGHGTVARALEVAGGVRGHGVGADVDRAGLAQQPAAGRREAEGDAAGPPAGEAERRLGQAALGAQATDGNAAAGDVEQRQLAAAGVLGGRA